MRLSDMGRSHGGARISPSHLLANYVSALMVENCPHAHGVQLAKPDTLSVFRGPMNLPRPAFESTGENRANTSVVAVDGANDLRMFALGCGGIEVPVVLRDSACLGCCLDVCRRTGFPVLVL